MNDKSSSDRRAFLEKCGKFAIVTPPVVTLMLTTDSKAATLTASGSSTTTQTITMMDRKPDSGDTELAMVVDSMGVMKKS